MAIERLGSARLNAVRISDGSHVSAVRRALQRPLTADPQLFLARDWTRHHLAIMLKLLAIREREIWRRTCRTQRLYGS